MTLQKPMNAALKLSLVCGLVFGVTGIGFADWQPVLLTKKGEQYRSPDTSFEIQIPADVSLEVLQRLALELDNVDVTGMVSREGNLAVFKPLSPLNAGRHELRIVEYLPDGSVIERGYWQFEVRQSSLFQKYSAGADADLSVSNRIHDKNLKEPPPDKLQASGSVNADFDAYNENLHTAGQVGITYNNINSDSGQRTVDIGDFLFSAEQGAAKVRLGHHQINASNLLLSGFNRRGVSGSYYLDGINTNASAFSFSSEALVGARDGLGIGDSRHRVDGIFLETSPLRNQPRKLYLTMTWLSGEGSGSSGLVASPFGSLDTTAKGNGLGFSIDSQLFEEKLWLHGEYAATDYDFDTSDSLQSEKDDAWVVSGKYGDSTQGGNSWSIGLEGKKVGTFYKSLANFSLPVDKKLLRAFGNYQWGEYSLQADLENQQDNIEGIAILPTVETRIKSFSLSWLPQFNEVPMFGYPSLTFNYFHQTQNQIETPAGYLYASIDNASVQYLINAQFSHTRFNWGVILTRTEARDYSGVTTNTDTDQYNLFGTYIFSPEISVPVNLAHTVTSYPESDFSEEIDSYKVDMNYSLFSGDLTGNAGISLNKSSNSYNSENTSLTNYTLGMTWHWIKAAENQPGLDVTLEAAFTDNKDKVDAVKNLNSNQIMLTLRTSVPFHLGQAQ